jgi:transcriptional regulator with XRE-family HTH domain
MAMKHKTLAEYLRRECVTQAEFARRVGVAQPVISRISTGRARPSLSLALRIAAAAKIPVESLLPPAGSSAPQEAA